MKKVKIITYVLFYFTIFGGLNIKAADVIEISPITNKILLVWFNEGHIDYGGIGDKNTEGRVLFYEYLNIDEATNKSNYSIISSDDPNYSTAKSPVNVGRKSKGRHFHKVDQAPQYLSWHFIYIEFPIELKSGRSYKLLLNNLAGNTNIFNFVYDERKIRSEAIHVTQAGFKPNDKKYAYISQFMGDFNSDEHENGGLNLDSYALNSFHLIDISNGNVVFNGSISLQKPKKDAETNIDMYGPYYNYTNADVWQCDFTTFTTPGRYKIYIDGIGCSYPFAIHDQAYRDAYYYAMKALFYQRSGIYKYVEEYDTIYPADYLSNKMFYDPVLDPRKHVSSDNFDKTKQVTGIWGWYHDAGDWDSYQWSTARTTAMLLMAYEMFPDNFYDGAVSNKWKRNNDDPWYDEGTNGIPDILDEAGWFIKFMRRAKDSLLASGYGTGGCPAYIGREAGSHTGTPSWNDSRDLAITKEDPGVTALYAGLAAWYASCLEHAGISSEKVNYWITDAEIAWQWAINNGVEDLFDNISLNEEPLFGLGCLYRATGKADYQTEFKNHFAIRYPDYFKSPYLDQIVSILYALLPTDHSNLDLVFQQTVSDKIKQDAYNGWQKNHENKGFRASHILNNQRPFQGAFNIPKTLYQAFVYKLEGTQEYYDAVKCIADYTLGGNQMNMVSMTGYGWNYDELIFHPDSWYLLDFNSMVYINPILNGYTSHGVHYTPDYFGWGFSSPNDEDFSRSSAYPVIWQKDGDPANMSMFPVGEARFFNRNSIAGSEFEVHVTCHNLAFTYGILAGNPAGYTPNKRPGLTLNLNDNDNIESDSTMTLSVSGSDDLARVEYYYDWHYIGASENSDANFSFDWKPYDYRITSGEYLITAKGFDEKGLSTVPTDEGDKNVFIKKTNYLYVSPGYLSFNYSSNIGQLCIDSDINWTLSENIDWLSAEKSNGYRGDTITINISENTDTIARSGNIVFSAENTEDVIITINQDGYVREVIISNITPSSCQSDVLIPGVKYYIDREYTVTEVPDVMYGEHFIRTSNNDKQNTSISYLNFTIDKESDLYIAYDHREAIPAWMNDWEKVPEIITVSDRYLNFFDLYRKHFNPGTITLGGAGTTSEGSMYIVVAVPDISTGNCNVKQLAPIVLYPNPGNGIFRVSGIIQEPLRVFNTTGQYVKSIDPGMQTLDISEFPDGMYFYFIDNSIVKFIKSQ